MRADSAALDAYCIISAASAGQVATTASYNRSLTIRAESLAASSTPELLDEPVSEPSISRTRACDIVSPGNWLNITLETCAQVV
jgi:hypothetical protein